MAPLAVSLDRAKIATISARNLHAHLSALLTNTGGFTLNPRTLRTLTPGGHVQGFMCGGVPGAKVIKVPAEHFAHLEVLADALGDNAELFSKPRTYLGAWIDDKGALWLEPAELFATRSVALSFARQRGELAIYDLAKGESVNVGDVALAASL